VYNPIINSNRNKEKTRQKPINSVKSPFRKSNDTSINRSSNSKQKNDENNRKSTGTSKNSSKSRNKQI